MTERITKRTAADNDREFARSVHHSAYRDVIIKQFGIWDEKAQDDFLQRIGQAQVLK